MSSGSTFKPFSSAAALQEFLLKEAGPGSLVLVPHQRLARQVWRRQRQRAREQGKRAVCLSNLKQLALAWIMYADENDDKLL